CETGSLFSFFLLFLRLGSAGSCCLCSLSLLCFLSFRRLSCHFNQLRLRCCDLFCLCAKPCLHDIPECARDADGSICTACDTYHQRSGELLDRADTEDIQYDNHDECRQVGVDTSRQRLHDTVVHKVFEALLAALCLKLLADTVEDDDRRVDRVTYNRKHTCDKCISYGHSRDHIERKHNKNVVD